MTTPTDLFASAPLSGAERFGLATALATTPPANFPPQAAPPADLDIDHYVFYKKFTCRCCDGAFQNWYPKEKRSRMHKLDMDLRPLYKPIDPTFYEVIICPQCGYGAPIATFEQILPFQKTIVRQVVTPQFVPTRFESYYTVTDAIQRYAYALYVSTVKSPNKYGERAYLCLKLSWFYKELGDTALNKTFAILALEGFSKAVAEENPPIMGMNYDTLFYIMAALAVTVGKYEVAMQAISKVVTSKSVSKQLKDMALMLKEDINAARA